MNPLVGASGAGECHVAIEHPDRVGGAISLCGGSGALTVGVTEGPDHITGTSELKDGNLNYSGLPGDPIATSGFIYGSRWPW